MTETDNKITSSQGGPVSGISQQPAAPGLSEPSNNGPSLRIATVPVNSDVLKQGNNKLFLIPVGDIDPSLLQSNLKVPSGQNIIIVKPQDLLNSVEEKKLKLKTQKLQQAKNISQNRALVNPKPSGHVTLVQAPPNVQAHAPTAVNTSQANVQANLVVEDDQLNQPRKENQVGTNLQANQRLTQPKIVAQMLNTLEGVDFKLGNLEPQQIVQGSQLEITTPQHVLLSKNVPANQSLSHLKTSLSQSVVKGSQDVQMETAPEIAGNQNMATSGIQVQKVGQNLPVTAVVIQAQKSIPSTSGGSTSCKPLNKVSQGIQTCQIKGTVLTQPKAKTIPVKSVHNVSQGIQTLHQRNVLGQSRAIPQVPKSLQGSFLKVTNPTTQCSTESKIQLSVHQTPNLPQVTPIVRPANQAAATTQSKTTSVFSQALAEKIPSSTPVAAPKLQNHTPSVWPSTKQFVVNLEGIVIEDKPSRGQPHKSESSVPEKPKIAKTDSQKGPTLFTELEKRGLSLAARLKTTRSGESQLKPIQHPKVNNTNPWRCSLCGKSSFENSLGCLFGPYDENKDASQAEAQTPVRKRKHNSTSDETESPTKLKPESNSTQEFWFHGDCIVWSPGVCVVGESLAGYKQAVNDSRFRVSWCDFFNLFYL